MAFFVELVHCVPMLSRQPFSTEQINFILYELYATCLTAIVAVHMTAVKSVCKYDACWTNDVCRPLLQASYECIESLQT